MTDDTFDDDDDDDNAAMREMMGFSSFGMHKPAAKAPLPPRSNASSATGSNAAPLSQRPKAFISQGSIPNTATPSQYAATKLIPASLPPLPLEVAPNPSTLPARPPQRHHQHPTSTYTADPSQGIVTTVPDSDAEYDPTNPSEGYRSIQPLYPPNTSSQETQHPHDFHPSNPPPNSKTQSPSHPTSFHPQEPTEPPAYTSPDTGISLSGHQMHRLSCGQVFNDNGDRIYFKPSFIEPNPWQELEEEQASYDAMKEHAGAVDEANDGW